MLSRMFFNLRQRRSLWRWARRGRPEPLPGAAKRAVLLEHAARHGLRTFVETGTLKGDTVYALLPRFDRLVTIEIEPARVAAARRRFADEARVEVLEGDSGVVLPRVVAGLREAALFWLDGHFTAAGAGDPANPCPVSAELESVLVAPVRGHVVLIDDARLFDGTGGYPALDDVRRWVCECRPDLAWSVERDIIRLVPG